MIRRPHERGAALLTVLLLVAVMSVLAVAILDDVRFGLRRTANAQNGAQAQWYALGAEALARAQLVRLAQKTPDRITLAGGWNNRPFGFPLDDGGLITGQLRDGTHCFNLNSVVDGAPRLWTRDEKAGLPRYRSLLAALGFSDGQAFDLAESLADWIDADVGGVAGSSDDAPYAGLPQRRLSSQDLLAEVSELRSVRGYTEDVYLRIRPYVCALPDHEAVRVNVNTLGPENATLLAALSGNRLSLGAARAVIERRPLAGWASTAEFLSQPPLSPELISPDLIDVRSGWFNLITQVRYGDAEVAATALIRLDGPDRTTVVARRWTLEE